MAQRLSLCQVQGVRHGAAGSHGRLAWSAEEKGAIRWRDRLADHPASDQSCVSKYPPRGWTSLPPQRAATAFSNGP